MARKKVYDEDGYEVRGKVKKPFYKKWWFWILAFIIIGGTFGGGDEENPETTVANESSSESAQPTESVVAESTADESEEKEVESSAVIEEESKEKLPEPSEVQFDPNDYNTDLTYEDLARNPDEHSFKAVTFEGTIIQVMQGDGYTQYRFAVNDDYDQVMLIEVDNSQLESRILENDYIRIYGTYFGEVTYESAIGANITVPSVVVEKFELL